MPNHAKHHPVTIISDGEEGFLLLGALVLVFLVLLTLSIAAPRVARQMQREKELESAHRANQYVRAIRMYYKKLGHYPGSIEQLEKTNNQRFLREKYIDPLTGKDDWRLIHVGENKTQVKSFFGEPLPGLQAGLGSAAGMASPTSSSTTAGAGGTSGGSAFNNSTGATGSGSSLGGSASGASSGASTSVGTMNGAPNAGAFGSGTAGTGAVGTGSSSSGIPTQNATTATGGGGGLIMGVGSSRTGEAMLVVNEQATYETWEFLYDPRIEQLYAKGNLLGGAVSSGSASSLGSASTLASPTGAAAPTNGTNSPSGTGTAAPSTPPIPPP